MKSGLPGRKSQVAASIVGVAVAILILQIDLDAFEFALFDLRLRTRPAPPLSGKIELVLMDRQTLTRFKGVPDFNAHEQLLNIIFSHNPKVVAYTTPLARLGDDEKSIGLAAASPEGSPEQRRKFSEFVSKFPNFFQLADKVALKSEIHALQLPEPLQKIKVLSAPRTVDTLQFGRDGVTRRMMLNYGGAEMGHLELLDAAGVTLDRTKLFQSSFIFYDTNQIWIDWRRSGTFPVTRFEEVLDGTIPDSYFKNKIVLIGDDFDKGTHAYVKTPQSKLLTTTFLEMQANMLETLITASPPRRVAFWINILLSALVGVISVHAVFALSPLRGIFCLLSVAAGVCAVGAFAAWPFGMMISISHPLLTLFLIYYFFIPYRLIVESRRSWEYFQKNQLLQQVETLKTNFISMMSHDLKTPLARIQGMLEILQNAKLAPEQLQAVDHIRHSTRDLLSFTDAVLSYARVESQGVELRKQSRDVNDLVTHVVRKFTFLAQEKKMQIETELEPLFPIQLDPELIQQVLSNLLENAIKYSPPGSKILVQTSEVGGSVRIAIKDEGPGIASDELPNIFVKFFRSKTAKNSSISGSGLGLYLAKYFVELHKGKIEVLSEVGKGSTFTIELPVGN